MGAIVAGGLAGLLNQSSAQVIDGSVKFDKATQLHLIRTPGSAGNQKTWTLSLWFQKQNLGDQRILFNAWQNNSNRVILRFMSDKLQFALQTGGTFYGLQTNQVFRDTGWYHVVFVLDTTQGTDTNRQRIYVNGSEIAAADLASNSISGSNKYPDEDSTFAMNGAYAHYFAANYEGSFQDTSWDGRISNAYLIDGLALGPGYFGFIDPLTNTWRPKKFRAEGTTINDGTVWSNSLTTNAGDNFDASGPKVDAFDGDSTDKCYTANNSDGTTQNTSYIQFNSPVVLNGDVEIYVDNGNAVFSVDSSGGLTLLGKNSSGSDNQRVRLGYIQTSKLRVLMEGGSRPAIGAISVDGVTMIDSTTTNLDFGTNGFYLPMDNDDFNIDKSGKGNNWTAVNFSGTSIDPDVLKDSPSGAISGGRAQTGITTTSSAPANYATLNPLSLTKTLTLSDGNLGYTATSAENNECFSNIRLNGGKFYFESNLINAADVPGSTSFRFGICKNLDGVSGSNIIIYNATGNFETFGTTDSSPPTYTAGNLIGVAVDCVNGSIQFFKDGVSVGTKPFTVGTDEWNTYIRIYKGGGNTVNGTINFGQKPFKYAPPQGFLPLNSASATPKTVITRPDQYVGVTTYTSNNSTLSVSDYKFQPDLLLFKNRITANHWGWFDSVRGANKQLSSNRTNAEITTSGSGYGTGTMNSFDPNGFTLGNDVGSNVTNYPSGDRHVVSGFKAGGNKNTFNVDDVGYASASDVNMSVGSLNSVSYDQSQTWSSLGSSSGWDSGTDYPLTKLFNGVLSSNLTDAASGNDATWTYTISNVSNFKIRLYVPNISNHVAVNDVKINGNDIVQKYILNAGLAQDNFHTIDLGNLGTFTSLFLDDSYWYVQAIYINNKMLVNNGVSVANVPSIANTGASVGTKQGFSIIKWTATNGAATINHGLKIPPTFIMVKDIDSSTFWQVYHSSLGDTEAVNLNSSNAASAATNHWNNTSPTSTTFSVGLNSNYLTDDHIAYIWHDVPGLQKFGSYINPSSTIGGFVELGFKPAVLIFKCVKNISSSSGAGDWIIKDTTRSPFNNPSDGNTLVLNVNNAEDDYYGAGQAAVDILSNGFKIRHPNSSPGGDPGRLYIYAAWAEAPTSNLYGAQSNAR